jgi:secondary thiamine-phosphate synthase enzyme
VTKQQEISIVTKGRGYYLITDVVEQKCFMLKEFRVGLAHLFLLHTSASLSINENFDASVRDDFRAFEEHLVPRDFPYKHSYEGSDDMPAHIKSSLFGNALTIPIKDGKFCLGSWQGIYLNEHRDRGSERNIVITAMGELR